MWLASLRLHSSLPDTFDRFLLQVLMLLVSWLTQGRHADRINTCNRESTKCLGGKVRKSGAVKRRKDPIYG